MQIIKIQNLKLKFPVYFSLHLNLILKTNLTLLSLFLSLTFIISSFKLKFKFRIEIALQSEIPFFYLSFVMQSGWHQALLSSQVQIAIEIGKTICQGLTRSSPDGKNQKYEHITGLPEKRKYFLGKMIC